MNQAKNKIQLLEEKLSQEKSEKQIKIEELAQQQTYIEELENERNANYEEYHNTYAKTMDNFYHQSRPELEAVLKDFNSDCLQLNLENQEQKQEIQELKKRLAQLENIQTPQMEAYIRVPNK